MVRLQKGNGVAAWREHQADVVNSVKKLKDVNFCSINQNSVSYITRAEIIFPANNEEQPKQDLASKLSLLKNITILIAEDEEGNFRYLEIVLKRIEAKIIWARDGAEAIELLKQNPAISIILMDINMPVMSGKEAMTRIKEFNKSVPVIALTAYAFNNEQEELLTMGFDAYIAKPIDPAQLIKLIGRLISN